MTWFIAYVLCVQGYAGTPVIFNALHTYLNRKQNQVLRVLKVLTT